MRRILWLSLLLVVLDLGTKEVMARFFAEREAWIVGGPGHGWGLTAVENPGTWLVPGAPTGYLLAIHLAAVLLLVPIVTAARWYTRWYRRSLPVDLATAAYAMAVVGQTADRLVVGAVRDWIAVPWAIGNLADQALWLLPALLVVELWRFPPARALLRGWTHLDPRRWVPPVADRPIGAPRGSARDEAPDLTAARRPRCRRPPARRRRALG